MILRVSFPAEGLCPRFFEFRNSALVWGIFLYETKWTDYYKAFTWYYHERENWMGFSWLLRILPTLWGFTSDYAYAVEKGFYWYFLVKNVFFRERKRKTLYYIIYGNNLKKNCNQLPSVVHKSFVCLLSFCFGQKMFPKFWFFLIQCWQENMI